MAEDFEDLFEYPSVWPNTNGGDLSVWKTVDHCDDYNPTYYHIEIEGYIGYKTLQDAVNYYQDMLDKLTVWIISYKKDHPNRDDEKYKKYDADLVYQTRDIEVRYNNDCYWIFTEPPEFPYIDGCKEWLEDVVKQLKTIKEK